MTRKNLNDDIHGDRAAIRGGNATPQRFDWSDFEGLGDNDRQSSNSSGGGYKFSNAPTPIGKSYGKGTGGNAGYVRCTHRHPPLKMPGTDLVIYGGSCIDPAVKDAEVYVGFDSGMRWTERHYPWKKGDEVLFKIQDMNIPDKPEEFRKLVGWVKKQLDDGRKVHCGCIGGHGRTGTFLAALVSEYGEPDAIKYVRDNYCEKAVESTAQVNFLHEQFNIVKAQGAKSGGSKQTSMGFSSKPSTPSPKIETSMTYAPMSGNSLWR